MVDSTHARQVTAFVIIATAGRPRAVIDPINAILAASPSLRSSGITVHGIISAPSESDVDGVSIPEGWKLILGTRGAAAQRNVALEALPRDTDFVFFFDDDAIPRSDYLSTAVKAFDAYPEVLAITGWPVVDGAPSQREIAVDEAQDALKLSFSTIPVGDMGVVSTQHRELYGCNFAVRWPALSDLRFDGRLPLYSWLEDHDYACRTLKLGPIAKVTGCVVAHRGSASGGRLSHRRFGYSQVANPIYLWQKGSFPFAVAAREVFRPVAKNLALAALPGSQGQLRRARLDGNLRAALDIVGHLGRARPEGMLEIAGA